ICLRIPQEHWACLGAAGRADKNVCRLCSDIIRYSHLTLYPAMPFGAPGLKKVCTAFALCMSLMWLSSCNGYKTPKAATHSGLSFRAFVSNPLLPNQLGGGSPGIEIVDASKDRLARFAISLLSLSSNVSSAG